MYVCLCHGVSENQIRQVVEAGADSVREVERHCGAGGDCGSCRRHVLDIIRRHSAEASCVPTASTDQRAA
jgi:bacterioferritin-associated ferredoxin